MDHANQTSWEVEKEKAHNNYLIGANGIQFIIGSLFAGIIIHFGAKKYNYPYTVGCFLFGVVVGLLDVHTEFVRNFTLITRMDPSDMMLAFLPLLIFESSFGMNAHVFYRALTQCLIIALPGLILCTALTAVFAKFALHFYHWSWFTAILFGSIVSATDPVAVISLLKEMRMPQSVTVLIEGESLLNDGVAIVLYDAFSELVIASDLSGTSFHFMLCLFLVFFISIYLASLALILLTCTFLASVKIFTSKPLKDNM